MHIITNMLKQGAKRKVTTYNIPQLLGDEQIPPRPPWLGLEDPEDPEPQTTDLQQQPEWLIEVSNDFLYAIRLQIPPSAASSHARIVRQDPQQAEFAGDNFIRYTGDVKQFSESQLYEITAQEIGSDIHMNAQPTLTAKVRD